MGNTIIRPTTISDTTPSQPILRDAEQINELKRSETNLKPQAVKFLVLIYNIFSDDTEFSNLKIAKEVRKQEPIVSEIAEFTKSPGKRKLSKRVQTTLTKLGQQYDKTTNSVSSCGDDNTSCSSCGGCSTGRQIPEW